MDLVWTHPALAGAQAPFAQTPRRQRSPHNLTSQAVSDIIHGRTTSSINTNSMPIAKDEARSNQSPRPRAAAGRQPNMPVWLDEMQRETEQSIAYMSAVIQGRAA